MYAADCKQDLTSMLGSVTSRKRGWGLNRKKLVIGWDHIPPAFDWLQITAYMASLAKN